MCDGVKLLEDHVVQEASLLASSGCSCTRLKRVSTPLPLQLPARTTLCAPSCIASMAGRSDLSPPVVATQHSPRAVRTLSRGRMLGTFASKAHVRNKLEGRSAAPNSAYAVRVAAAAVAALHKCGQYRNDIPGLVFLLALAF